MRELNHFALADPPVAPPPYLHKPRPTDLHKVVQISQNLPTAVVQHVNGITGFITISNVCL